MPTNYLTSTAMTEKKQTIKALDEVIGEDLFNSLIGESEGGSKTGRIMPSALLCFLEIIYIVLIIVGTHLLIPLTINNICSCISLSSDTTYITNAFNNACINGVGDGVVVIFYSADDTTDVVIATNIAVVDAVGDSCCRTIYC